LTQFVPLLLIPGAPDLAGFTAAEPAALARLALRCHDVGLDIGLTFFGFALLIEGALAFRSGFFPRWLGGLYMLAGACYLTSCFDYFLALNLPIAPWVQLGSLAGESAMALWLLIVGVNDNRWQTAVAVYQRTAAPVY
jgi:hypothetical protein